MQLQYNFIQDYEYLCKLPANFEGMDAVIWGGEWAGK